MNFCSHAPEYVMGIDEVAYYGCSQSHALEFSGDLILNFTKTQDTPSVMGVSSLAEHINIEFDEEIMVPWPDFSIPKVKHSFWMALHKYIQNNNYKDVCFHCEAGHGRTGTALCSMLIAIQGYTPEEAVWHVRTHYCLEAVETWEQCQYLQELDEYYNDREIVEENCPIPSQVLKAAAKAAEEKKKKEEKLAAQEDKYEGFKGIKPR